MPFPRAVANEVLEDIRGKTAGVGFGARLTPRLPSEDPLPAAVPRDDRAASRLPERRRWRSNSPLTWVMTSGVAWAAVRTSSGPGPWIQSHTK